MQLNFTRFYPLPERGYDLNRFGSYIDYVMAHEREKIPLWHCFAIYDDDLIPLIRELIEEHDECECYAKDIIDYDLDFNEEEDYV